MGTSGGGLEFSKIFLQLVANDKEFQASLVAREQQALKSATTIEQAFSQAFRRAQGEGGRGPVGMPSGGAGVAQTEQERIAQLEQRRAEIAEQRAAGTLRAAAADEKGTRATRAASQALGEANRTFREGSRLSSELAGNILGQVNPALGQFAQGGFRAAASASSMGLAMGVAVGVTVALSEVASIYIERLKDMQQFQTNLNLAFQNQDAGAVATEINKLTAEQERAAVIAEGYFRSMQGDTDVPFENLITSFQLVGINVQELGRRMEKARVQFNLLFQVFEIPKLAAAALRDFQQAQASQLQLDQKNATSAEQLIAVGEKRIKNLQDQGAAAEVSIKRDAAAAEQRLRQQGASPETIAAFLATVQTRIDALRQSTATTIQSVRQDIDRAAAEFQAKQAEALGRDLAFQRRRTDAALTAAKEIVEAESQMNVGLEQSFAARRQLQDAQARSQLAGLAEESAARRASIGARLQGATGDERIQLERELTEVTQEEATKRTEILAQAATQAIALAQRERQERIARAEDLFSIQRTLNQRRIQDDLTTQGAIAKSAEAGSKVQIDALKRVADLQAQLQQRAQSVLSQALSVADQARQGAGLEGATFVSRESLRQDLERQKRRDAEIRAQFESGASVRAEELRGAVGNLPFEQQFADFGSRIGDVFSAATTPLQEAFRTTVGPVVDGELQSLATRATAGFEGLVTGAGTQLGNLEQLFSDTIDRMVGKADAGFSQIADSISRSVEDRLARGLRDLERRS